MWLNLTYAKCPKTSHTKVKKKDMVDADDVDDDFTADGCSVILNAVSKAKSIWWNVHC